MKRLITLLVAFLSFVIFVIPTYAERPDPSALYPIPIEVVNTPDVNVVSTVPTPVVTDSGAVLDVNIGEPIVHIGSMPTVLAKEPVQMMATLPFSDTERIANIALFNVPVGKQLVLEYISARVKFQGASWYGKVHKFYVDLGGPLSDIFIFLPVVKGDEYTVGTDESKKYTIYYSSQKIKGYISAYENGDPGQLQLYFERTLDGGPASLDITITGYLLDLPISEP